MILAKVFVYNPVVLKQMRSLLTHLKTLTTYTIKLYLMIVAFYKLVSSQLLKIGKSLINQMIIINIFFGILPHQLRSTSCEVYLSFGVSPFPTSYYWDFYALKNLSITINFGYWLPCQAGKFK